MDKIVTWHIERYTTADAPMWDEKVKASRNGTFLHQRRYMDYHSDRFRDCSLIAKRSGKPVALLPADITDDMTLRSHGGLTYGGWILPVGHIDGGDVLSLFQEWIEWCRRFGIKRIDYRPVPEIYHRQPSSEDIYALFRFGARQEACGLSSTINYRYPASYNTLRRRLLRKASALGATICECEDVAQFHAMLTQCLDSRHSAVPVHSAAELQLLRDRFPQNIRIFTIALDGELMAGVCMYLTESVAHAQYIATTPQGRQLNLLTPLFDYLINIFASSHQWFDFGISTEHGGEYLNEGLLRQKFSFGGGGTVYQRFILDL